MNDYAEKWKEFSRRRRNVTIAFLAGIGAEISLLSIMNVMNLLDSYQSIRLVASIFLTQLPVTLCQRRAALWPCPRCAKPFVGRQTLHAMFQRMSLWPDQCEHCGLPECADAPGEESSSTAR